MVPVGPGAEVGAVFEVDPTGLSMEFVQHIPTGRVLPIPVIAVLSGPDGKRKKGTVLPLELLKFESMTEGEMFEMVSMFEGAPETEGYVN